MSLEYYDLISDQWADYILEDWKEKLAALGFEDAEIQYSGFGSQGDGASFTAVVKRDWSKLMPEAVRQELGALRMVVRLRDGFIMETDAEICAQISARIERSRSMNYVHEYMIDANVECEDGPTEGPADMLFDQWIVDLHTQLTEEARTLSRQIYRALEAAYWHECEWAKGEWEERQKEEEEAA